MKTLFGQLGKNSQFTSTYHIGLLQTKAYKVLMGKTSKLLEYQKISNTEWVALGIISDHPQGIRSMVLAETLAVEQPFITVIVNNMVKRGYLKVSVDPTDKRAKIIHLSKEGKTFVKQTESRLVSEMNQISANISISEALAYFKVLQAIVDYSENIK